MKSVWWGLRTGTCVAVLAMAPLGAAWAGEGAAAIVERQALMKLQGASAGAIKAAIDSKDAARLKQVEGNARALAASSAAIPTRFPRGSDSKAGKTAALPVIWEKPADFKKAADGMGAEATALAEALKAGDVAAATAQFGKLGQMGCGGCHNTFRQKQN